MFGKKKKKELDNHISTMDIRISELESNLNELQEDLDSMRERIEKEIDELFGNMRNYKYDHRAYHDEMQKEFKESIEAIEAHLYELADMIDVLRKPPKEQKRCGICGRILIREMYIGTSYRDEKLVIDGRSGYVCNPIPICEHCAELDMDRLSYLYMKALSKEKEE